MKARVVPSEYIEGLNDARTPYGKRRVSARQGWAGEKGDVFSTLLDWSFPGRRKRMIVDQFLVRGEIIGFNGEVLLIERLRAGRGTEVGAIRLSLLLRGEPAQPIFRHP